MRTLLTAAVFGVMLSSASGQTFSEARESILAHYADLDRAASQGRLASLANLLADDATLKTGSEIRPLVESFSGKHLGVRKTTLTAHRGDLAPFELKDKVAQVRIRTITERSVGAITSLNESYALDTWEFIAGVWKWKRSEQLIDQDLPPKIAGEESQIVAAQIRNVASPIEASGVGQGYKDLAPIGIAVGDARIVALGEASHGSSEIFRMKHRLIEYLVNEKGFSILAFEGNWPGSLAADRYVKTGSGDLKAALAGFGYWNLQCEEVLGILEWMRAYNQKRGSKRELSVVGVDIQGGSTAQTRVLEGLERSDRESFQVAKAAYEELDSQMKKGIRGQAFAPVAERMEAIATLLGSRRELMQKSLTGRETLELLQMTRVVAMNARRRVADDGNYRDEMLPVEPIA